MVSSGQLNSVGTGGTTFANANLTSIAFNSFSPVLFPAGTSLSFKLNVRNACVGSAKNSGTVRLWYNDSAANSRFGATIGANAGNYYLGNLSALLTSPGSVRKTIDVAAGAKCSAFKTFGTWSITL